MSSLELNHLDDAALSEDVHRDSFSRTQHHPTTQSLAPIDGGLQAWRVLLAAFMFEAILWGFPLSFGIFQEYYSTIPEFEGSPYITYIGSIATGLCYMGAPLMAPLVKSLVAGSFADEMGALIVTQGVMYGVGYLIIFYPVVSMVNEWWVARRGLSWGILLGSSGASGVAYPFIIEALLHKYGYKTTLRAMAVATVIMTGPLLPSMKGRLPASHSSSLAKTDWSFMKQPIFWLYILSTTSQSLGFYLPSLYLPSYASTAGLDSRLGAMLIALMNVSSVAGQFTYGYLSDGRIPLNMLLLSTMLVSTVVALTLWGLAKSLVTLVIFALIYGFFAYAFLAMRVRMGTAVAAEQSDTMVMFCLFSFAQGIGNVLAGPISGMLLTPYVEVHEYGYGRYKTLIVFTGAAMFTSAIFAGLAHLVPAKRNTR
ncbi:MFS general substrate transporter [Aureobasidium subglaciale]|nr:MFS general substrate transporter [Aureobasidium subglaciale]KAI5226119.1 MFS general substrate transporter [Aureobasidium subglaciale]KAI5229453.1 MFS general substrate transporter [Aureobasidium subglaciale]KAI5264251.1 MFS general substrate transporter [Aureobasidium subglaciale]